MNRMRRPERKVAGRVKSSCSAVRSSPERRREVSGPESEPNLPGYVRTPLMCFRTTHILVEACTSELVANCKSFGPEQSARPPARKSDADPLSPELAGSSANVKRNGSHWCSETVTSAHSLPREVKENSEQRRKSRISKGARSLPAVGPSTKCISSPPLEELNRFEMRRTTVDRESSPEDAERAIMNDASTRARRLGECGID